MNNKIDELLRRVQSGDTKMDDLVGRSDNYKNDILKARNLEEKALGKLMLEQYKGKVPNEPSLDFLEGLREQFLPDVKSKIEMGFTPGAGGIYSPSRDLIKVNPLQAPESFVSALAHEGLHSRDLKAGDYGDVYDMTSGSNVNKSLRGIAPELITESGLVKKPRALLDKIKATDIDELKEVLLKGHHGLKRGATAAKANLPRLLKGLGLLSTGAISLGAEAADSPEAGDPNSQAAHDREMDAQKKMKEIEKADVPNDVKLKALEMFKKNKIPY